MDRGELKSKVILLWISIHLGFQFTLDFNSPDHKIDPNQFLADYDVMMWNRHIYQLSDYHHQRKMISQLNIPCH
jgi:hypothetical protein